MTLFLTGFPGFLGSRLLPRLLGRAPGSRAVCLVQPRWAGLARARLADLRGADGAPLSPRVRLVEGDIARPGLAMANGEVDVADITEIVHLAAVYDLGVSLETGMRVNVDGTRRVLELAERCPRLRRFHHVSTCYVSGRHEGVFREEDLDVGQRFGNHYEETKFLSEVAVREAIEGGLPCTVYRPAIVVGDHSTGETQKYDGPYYFIRLLLRQPRVALMPVIGRPDRVELNVVPRDFIVAAIAHLATLEASENRTYHLADPDPPTLDEAIRAVGRAVDRRVIRVRLPLALARAATRHVPGVRRLTGVPAEALDYFAHPTRYDTQGAERDLEGSGIAVPPFTAYVGRLVDFLRENPDVPAEGMA